MEHVQAAEIIALVRQIQADFKALRDEFEALDARYEKLRGRFYNTQRGKGEQEQQQPVDRMSRSELKAYLARSGRFIPGKPAVHSE